MGRQKKPFNHLQKLPLGSIQLIPPAAPGNGHDGTLQALMVSLQTHGQREPVLVAEVPEGSGYRLVVGRRRYLAARELGWPELECIVLGRDLQAETKVISQLQAGQFEPFELADTLESLKRRCDWTQTHLGYAIGKTRDFVANILAITQISPEVRQVVLRNSNGRSLSARHLRYVARAEPAEQLAVANQIISEHLSTKSLERQNRSAALEGPDHEFIRVRQLRRAGSPSAPRTLKEWRRYFRQLSTDLRRVEKQEAVAGRRAQDLLLRARVRQRTIRKEANHKRRLLARELKQARKNLSRMGAM